MSDHDASEWLLTMPRNGRSRCVGTRNDLQDATFARELTSTVTDPVALAGMGIKTLGWSVERQQALLEADGPERVAEVLEALWSRE